MDELAGESAGEEPHYDDFEEERRVLSMTLEEIAEEREEARFRRVRFIWSRLRVALRENPPGDAPIFGWVVRHFAPNVEHVLEAYQVLLQGAFGRVEPIRGKPEDAYRCGAKTLHAYPARLVEDGPYWIAVASQVRRDAPLSAGPFAAPDGDAAIAELVQSGRDELRLHGPYRTRDDAACSLNAWLEGRTLDP